MDPNTQPQTPQPPESAASNPQSAASPMGSPQSNQQPTQTPLPSSIEPEDPGKVLAIVSLVVGVLVWSVIGLILAIIARNKSKAAGIQGGISKVAFIVNLVLVIVGGVLLLLFIPLVFLAVPALQKNSQSTQGRVAASAAIATMEEYASNHEGAYPKSLEDLESTSRAGFTVSETKLEPTPTDPMSVELYGCDDGVKVGYWNYNANKVEYQTNGNPQNCILLSGSSPV